MKRAALAVLAVIAGLVVWMLVATVANLAVRRLLPGYAAAEPTMQFTAAMMAARLLTGALASLAGGAAVALVSPRSLAAAWVAGLIALVVFVPEHLRLWHVFPVWYHLTFLSSLVPLYLFGAMLIRWRAA